jgi:ribosomal protein S27AE
MNLESAFLFWPVRVAGVAEGWIHGTYISSKQLGIRELLEKRKLRWGRRHKGTISEAQVQRSFLHYEALGAALETDRVLLETFQLGEQKFCEPVALVSKQKAKEALIAFLNLPDRHDDTAVRYVEQFGEFDHLELDGNRFVGSQIPAAVQRICGRFLDEHQDPFAVSLTDFWGVRDSIEGLWNLSLAVSSKDPQRAREECIRRRPHSSFRQEPKWLAVAKAILCADLSAALNLGMHNPRLILSEEAGKLVALTMGTTVRTALYLTLLDMIVSKTEYRTCPNCGKHFLVTQKRKKFCSGACQNTAKVRRFRFRHNQRSKSSGAEIAEVSRPTRRR